MKNTKNTGKFVVNFFCDGDSRDVNSAIINIFFIGIPTVSLLWWLLLIIFTVMFFVDILCLIYQTVIKPISLAKYKLKQKTRKTLKKLDSSKIEVFPLDSETDTLNQDLVENICHEIVRDQIGRAFDENEKVSVIESDNLVDGSVLVIFRYRRHDQKKVQGSTKDKLISSVHTVRLTLNKLAQSVHIENVMSVDSDNISHLQDPKGFIRDSFTALTGPVSVGDSTKVMVPVVKQMISD